MTTFSITFGSRRISYLGMDYPPAPVLAETANSAALALGVDPRDAVAAHLARLDGEPHNEQHAAAYDAAELAVDAQLDRTCGGTPHDGFGVVLE